MRKHLGIFAGAALLALHGAGAAYAGAAPEEALSVLQERGYTDVEIEHNDAPGYQAWACKGGTRFSVRMDAQSNIVDVDPVGSCGGSPRLAGDIHVQAPFADVRVGEGRVRIRAPFVDLDIR